MRIDSTASDAALLQEIGRRVAKHRLRRNWTQQVLAEEAGISRPTLQRIEAGRSAQLASVLRVLRALDLLDGVEALVPEPLPSPLELLERDAKGRQRASARQAEAPKKPWRWGDEK